MNSQICNALMLLFNLSKISRCLKLNSLGFDTNIKLCFRFFWFVAFVCSAVMNEFNLRVLLLFDKVNEFNIQLSVGGLIYLRFGHPASFS